MEDTGFTDTDLPPSGDGFFYLVHAQNFECGLGTLGFASSELERATSGLACSGIGYADHHADGETSTFGSVSGTYQDTLNSDDVHESITEAPVFGFYTIRHRWTIPVSAGSRTEFHVESYRSVGPDDEWLLFRYSLDGGTSFFTFQFVPPSSNDNTDLVSVMPESTSGTVLIELFDVTTDAVGVGTADTCHVDEIWIRNVP